MPASTYAPPTCENVGSSRVGCKFRRVGEQDQITFTHAEILGKNAKRLGAEFDPRVDSQSGHDFDFEGPERTFVLCLLETLPRLKNQQRFECTLVGIGCAERVRDQGIIGAVRGRRKVAGCEKVPGED